MRGEYNSELVMKALIIHSFLSKVNENPNVNPKPSSDRVNITKIRY